MLPLSLSLYLLSRDNNIKSRASAVCIYSIYTYNNDDTTIFFLSRNGKFGSAELDTGREFEEKLRIFLNEEYFTRIQHYMRRFRNALVSLVYLYLQ